MFGGVICFYCVVVVFSFCFLLSTKNPPELSGDPEQENHKLIDTQCFGK